MFRLVHKSLKPNVGYLSKREKCAAILQNVKPVRNKGKKVLSTTHYNLLSGAISNQNPRFLPLKKNCNNPINMSNVYTKYMMHKSIWNFTDMLLELQVIGNSLMNPPAASKCPQDIIVLSSDEDCIIVSSEHESDVEKIIRNSGKINHSASVAVQLARRVNAARPTHQSSQSSISDFSHDSFHSHKKTRKVVATKNAMQQRLLATRPKVQTLMSSSFCTNSNSKSQSKSNISEQPKSNKEPEYKYPSTEELKKVLKQYPFPKNALNNIFTMVAQQLNDKSYTVNPVFKHQSNSKGSKSSWAATYNLKWPKEVSFSATASTKQNASTSAALLALHYLLSVGKIRKSAPVLEEFDAEVQKTKIDSLELSAETLKSLSRFHDIYNEVFVPKLVEDLTKEDTSIKFKSSENMWPLSRRTNKMKNLSHYSAHEPINLPISEFKNSIIELANNNRVLIVRGEPGCGKSTRVPQYVLEGWARTAQTSNCRIMVTQPRRIAAISLAERVANERNERAGGTIGYQVRFKSNYNANQSHIIYCTTGILLRRLQTDPKLSDCTHVILDEAHERDVNTDLLLNLLRRALKENDELKVLVMSATIKAELFQEYFKDAATIDIPGFTHPVKELYLNPGVQGLQKTVKMCEGQVPAVFPEEVANLVMTIHERKPEGAILVFLPGWDEIIKVKKMLPSHNKELQVLCLHSRMPDTEQRMIFYNFPPGVRKVILATNIAETSVTVNDVVYVLDTGIKKDKRFDAEKGVVCLDNHWISQASAIQRKGRAGRVQPGECYHLYTEEKFRQFEKYSAPEIQNTSLTKIVLDSKAYSNNMKAVDFLSELLTPPDAGAISHAVEELYNLELLDDNENLTPLGRVLSEFQLEPKLAKAMVNSVIFKCVTPIVDIVTLFSSELEIFNSALTDKENTNKCKKRYSNTSDHLALMRLLEQWLAYIDNGDDSGASNFCDANGVVEHKLNTIKRLRDIHFEYLHKGLHNILPISDKLSDSDEMVRSVILSGVDTLLEYTKQKNPKDGKSKDVLLTRNNHKATITSDSVNFKRFKYPSNFLLYLNETRSNVRRTTMIRETSLLTPLSVVLFKRNNLLIEKYNYNPSDLSKNIVDPVVLKLQDTNIKFVCNKGTAEVLKKCKEAMRSAVQYYIYQLTVGAEYDRQLNETWTEILENLNNALAKEAEKIAF